MIVLAAVIAVARGGAVGLAAAPARVVAAPVAAAPVVAARFEEYDPLPQYTYAYDVQDALTGDSKAQFETRNGDIVQGRLELAPVGQTRARCVLADANPTRTREESKSGFIGAKIQKPISFNGIISHISRSCVTVQGFRTLN